MPIPKPKTGEDQNEYVSRCMEAIGGEYDDNTQAVAICYATYDKENMSKNKFSEFRIKTQMALAKADAESKGVSLADYPWDECIADQTERYGDEETAKRVCGYIKSEYGGGE